MGGDDDDWGLAPQPSHETVFHLDGARDEHGYRGEIGWNGYVRGLPLALGLGQDTLDRIVTLSVKIAIQPEIAFELGLPTLILCEGSQERAGERIRHPSVRILVVRGRRGWQHGMISRSRAEVPAVSMVAGLDSATRLARNVRALGGRRLQEIACFIGDSVL
ncbi:hypothetical protein [Methylobacterium sp.]|uniref:hypothetical protein n=1 Tax=Methylobacterium sp. TaxID=409 RepID=UPI003B5A412D